MKPLRLPPPLWVSLQYINCCGVFSCLSPQCLRLGHITWFSQIWEAGRLILCLCEGKKPILFFTTPVSMVRFQSNRLCFIGWCVQRLKLEFHPLMNSVYLRGARETCISLLCFFPCKSQLKTCLFTLVWCQKQHGRIHSCARAGQASQSVCLSSGFRFVFLKVYSCNVCYTRLEKQVV